MTEKPAKPAKPAAAATAQAAAPVLQLADLQTHGGFVDQAPVKAPIEWTDEAGTVHTGTVWVMRQPFGEMEKLITDDAPDRSSAARMISQCIRLGDDASQRLSYEQAYRLRPALGWAMARAINAAHAPKH